MHYWEADLSDGSTIHEDGNDISHWAKVLQHCNENGLEIVEFRVVNDNSGKHKVIDKLADGYFVINQITGFMRGGSQSRRGIGSVRYKSNKVRIEWYEWPSRKFVTAEITRGIGERIPEISVARRKPQ